MSFNTFCGQDPANAATYQRVLLRFQEGGGGGGIAAVNAGANIDILNPAIPVVALQNPLTATLNLGAVDVLATVGGAGAAGQILSSQGAGAGTQWIAAGGGGNPIVNSTNALAVVYPVLAAGGGAVPRQMLAADLVPPMSVNVANGDFNVADTVIITQSQLAIGKTSGAIAQSAGGIAIGFAAANSNQGQDGISIGSNAGNTTQGIGAVAIGAGAANNNQGIGGIAIGQAASTGAFQGAAAIAIGVSSCGDPLTSQGNASIAIGSQAGFTSQGAAAVAIGEDAGYGTQSQGAVAIGDAAGNITQGADAVAIGTSAGLTNQAAAAIAIGNLAGQTQQGINAVAIGLSSGTANQGQQAVAVGAGAGDTAQGQQAVAIGFQSGQTNQGADAVAIGTDAGQAGQAINAIAIGNTAGATNQGQSVAIGNAAGNLAQSNSAVAIGTNAGNNQQGVNGIAIGNGAGQTQQSAQGVAIGSSSGNITQGIGAIAIGDAAGNNNQGANAIAIGENAATLNQVANSICLNATGAAVQAPTASLYVAPIINSGAIANPVPANTNFLLYNPATTEITYGDGAGIGGGGGGGVPAVNAIAWGYETGNLSSTGPIKPAASAEFMFGGFTTTVGDLYDSSTGAPPLYADAVFCTVSVNCVIDESAFAPLLPYSTQQNTNGLNETDPPNPTATLTNGNNINSNAATQILWHLQYTLNGGAPTELATPTFASSPVLNFPYLALAFAPIGNKFHSSVCMTGLLDITGMGAGDIISFVLNAYCNVSASLIDTTTASGLCTGSINMMCRPVRHV